jgi:DNA polymerase/3'-5' exonuclease PolX
MTSGQELRHDFFHGKVFTLLPVGSLKGKVRRDIIAARLLERGATESEDNTEHLIAIACRQAEQDSLRKRLPRSFKGTVVDVAWVTDSVAAGTLLDMGRYLIDLPTETHVKSPKHHMIDAECPQSANKFPNNPESPNKKLSRLFEELAEMASTSPDRRNSFRALAYRKAAAVVRETRDPIETDEDADCLRSRLGQKTIEKIKEFIHTGSIGKLELVKREDVNSVARNALAGIWGVGPVVAADLARQGFDSIDKLRSSGQQLLNENQKTGLAYYEELLPKMPRSEVQEIADYVDQVRSDLFGEALEMIVCGSFRRGSEYCSDADLLFSWKRGSLGLTGEETLQKLVRALHDKKFIVDYFNKKNHNTVFLGICRIAPDRQARRLDMKVWPRESLACALLHFTGNADFNRRLRLYAKRHGYKLNDLGLTRADGTIIHCKDECGIFNALGLKYLEPEERTSAAELKKQGGAEESDEASDMGSISLLSE